MGTAFNQASPESTVVAIPRTLTAEGLAALGFLSTPVWVINLGEGIVQWANPAAPLPPGHTLQTPTLKALRAELPLLRQQGWAWMEALPGLNGSGLRLSLVRLEGVLDPLALVEGPRQVSATALEAPLSSSPAPSSTDVARMAALEALRHSPLMVSVFDVTGRLLYWNAAARQAFETAETHTPPTFDQRFSDRSAREEAWRHIMDGHIYHADLKRKTNHGERWHTIEARLHHNSATPLVVVVEQDTGTSVRTAQALRDTVRRLVQAQQELDQFTFASAHDLREPLRQIISYLSLVARRMGGSMDAETHEFMSFALEGAHRIDSLTSDLAEYVSVGRSGLPLRPLALAEVIGRARQTLAAQIALADARIDVLTPLPTVIGDRDDLTLLFTHLLSNALKFQKPGRPPHIEISADAEGNGWVVMVRDFGIGLDIRYSERIFQIFRRLHTRETYPGNGVGLAICKKVIDRHGGRIWLESAPNQGTAVFFNLPGVDSKGSTGGR